MRNRGDSHQGGEEEVGDDVLVAVAMARWREGTSNEYKYSSTNGISH